MANIKQLQTRKYKITVSNGYRPDGRKISRAKTITVPDTVRKQQIPQYVAHVAEEFERLVKNGFCEDSSMSAAARDSRRMVAVMLFILSCLVVYFSWQI